VNALVKHRNVINSSTKGGVGSEAAAASTGELVRLLKVCGKRVRIVPDPWAI